MKELGKKVGKQAKEEDQKRREEERERQARQHSYDYWRVLHAVYLELNRTLGWEDDQGYEARELYSELDREDYPEEERELVRRFEEWAWDASSDGLELSKILNLDSRTKNWLKRNCENWPRWLHKAQNAIRISDTLERQINYRLAQIILDLLQSNFLGLYGEIEGVCAEDEASYEAIYRTFILEKIPYTDNDSRFPKVKRQALQRMRAELDEAKGYLDTLEPAKPKRFPFKWITENRAIMANLSRKGNRHMLKIYELLMDQRMSFTTTRDKLDGMVENQHAPVPVQPNHDLIKRETGLKANTQVGDYLREMAYQGIIERYGLDGERGQMLYQIGDWKQGNARFPRPVYWLKDTPEMRRALREFWTNRPRQSGQ